MPFSGSAIEDNLKPILVTLEGMSEFTFDRPTAERRKLRTRKR